MRDHVTALILAGGKATRLGGVAKHELVVDGRTIFERQVSVLAPRVQEILVATPSEIAGYRCVRDVLPDVGPLAGIAAGLRAMTTPWLLVVAGDMPHLSGAVLDLALDAASELDQAVAFRLHGLPEPLVCMLSRRAAPAVERRLQVRRNKVAGLLTEERLHVRWIEESAVRAVDPELGSFCNVNEPEDLRGITGSKPA
ncbi:MAG: molybdenum cofactor guanylyltransferase [Deltaproteobacteria bacterium]|nr:molybdenum cofactor guanylyltransferase [Deltaproteobacteria bacterium]